MFRLVGLTNRAFELHQTAAPEVLSGNRTSVPFLAWCVAREALSQVYKKMIPHLTGVWGCSTAYLAQGPRSDVEFFHTFCRNMHTAAASEMEKVELGAEECLCPPSEFSIH